MIRLTFLINPQEPNSIRFVKKYFIFFPFEDKYNYLFLIGNPFNNRNVTANSTNEPL